jgi:hypothetical protein
VCSQKLEFIQGRYEGRRQDLQADGFCCSGPGLQQVSEKATPSHDALLDPGSNPLDGGECTGNTAKVSRLRKDPEQEAFRSGGLQLNGGQKESVGEDVVRGCV